MAGPTVVTIIMKPNGKLGVDKNPAKIDRDNQQLTWVIGVSGYSWPSGTTGGVVPKANPPAPFKPWPGNTPTLVGSNYQADAGAPLPHGSPRANYRYDIFLHKDTGETFVLTAADNFEAMVAKYGKDHVVKIDPDIQNDPLP